MNKSFLTKQILRLLAFFIIIAITHYLLLLNKLPTIYLASQPWKIYLFIVPLTGLGLFYIVKRYQKDKTSMVNTFMLYTIMKMVTSLFFLFPWIYYKDASSKPMIIQFFAIFFPILLLETIFLVRLLSNYGGQDEKK